jgi:chromosome segregation ATPase
MSNVPETYLYEVRPIGRPIVLGHGVEITARKSLYLTKEDVLKCLETAYVYRRFALREPERVTTANIDRVHRQVYIPESEWADFLKKNNDDKAATETADARCANFGEISDELPVVEESNKEVKEPIETTEEVAEPESEEVVPVEEEVQDVEVDSETVDADVEEDVDEDEAAEATEDELIADIVEDDNETGVSTESQEQLKPSQNNVKYVYKKHNNKKKH